MFPDLSNRLGKKPGAPVIRVSHRGAGKPEPENTLRSYEKAIRMGADMVEVDIRSSADGVLVLAHDDEIRDVNGREIAVSEHPLKELRTLDLGEGERIPTLAEAVEACAGRCAMMADLKGEGFEEDLVHAFRDAKFENVVIPGGSAFSRSRIRQLDPSLPISLSLDAVYRDVLTDDFFAGLDTDAVTWQSPLLDAETVERLHDLGKVVFAWTVDRREEMDRLIAAGVDGIISNRTDLLMTL
jgi:glycerophosphoryl diester phosphodiesterase